MCENVTQSCSALDDVQYNCISSELNTIDPERSSVFIDKTPYTVVTEGKAEVLFPSSHDVFYNPVQEFNRDMSIGVIKSYLEACMQNTANKSGIKVDKSEKECGGIQKPKEGITVLEALAASGLRSVRYAKEIPCLTCIIANDFSHQAVESMKRNIKHNKVEEIVVPSKEEAAILMYQHRSHDKRFHIIDVDPYGSPAPFLDSAVQAVRDGGLLMITCTDMAILCGNSSETCRAKYGAVSLKMKSGHEMALRIVLQSIESHANRYGRYIVPVLSLSADFYVRVFVKIYTSPSIVKQSTSKLAMVYLCTGCETYNLQPLGKCIQKEKSLKFSPGDGPPVDMLCSHCQHRHQIGGPIWAANLYDKDFVLAMLQEVQKEEHFYGTGKRMIGTLSVILEELEDCPLYYTLDRLCGVVHCTMPSMLQFRSAILNAGYQVSLSHTNRTSIKTNAPASTLWDIIRTWTMQNSVKRKLEKGSAAEIILNKKPCIEVSFSLRQDANPSSRQQNLLRFQVNPEPHWGPKARARTSLWSEKQIEKQQRKQGKRTKIRSESLGSLKKYPCKRFKTGECGFGDKCRYSHNFEDKEAEGKNENYLTQK
ncbi:tRNA (guanine(26)-N(2))-dimethyltransferase-like isoform X2 [Limulus polyphemus]|uniref:tRNA (guanine(26)-N(2))-dimethyltransferase n=1 Tax=Limulus polyphemus TaxID=6850 RepID=A0ABM1BMD2_LIMPO|nr:tRNA (guanine(26)-N(2))-dimethyltransferase-like isoform X2 [Limulus polyphemus]